MNVLESSRFREMQLVYIGKLMAGLSHEFKNHLAIIKELNGLLQDLLMLAESESALNPERFQKIISGIDERISQAAEMCRYLSGFAHRMDQPLASFSVAEVVEEEIYLLSRFARQKQVQLIADYGDNLPLIHNNPALLQFMFFCLVWPQIESGEAGSRVLIKALRQDEAVLITLRNDDRRTIFAADNIWLEMGCQASHLLQIEPEITEAIISFRVSSI